MCALSRGARHLCFSRCKRERPKTAPAEATEEVILNALLGARTLSGTNGRTAHALTPDLLRWAVGELALGEGRGGP